MKLSSAFRPVLAAFAILLSPGILGPWLDLAHACPAAPAAVTPAMAGHAGHHQGGEQQRHGQPDGQQCQCVGTCHLAALPAPRGTAVVAVAVATPAASGFHAVPSSSTALPAHTLPFAHAPPSLA